MAFVRSSRIWAVALVPAVLAGVVGCGGVTAGIGGGGAFISFEIGGQKYTFTFGNVGPIEVRANETTTAPVGFTLFEQTPTDTPPSGEMRLPAESVGVGRLLTAKGIRRAQALPLDGSATLQFDIASGQSASLCDTAVPLAEFDVTFNTGVVSIAEETQSLSAAALDIIADSEVTICVSVTSDFDTELTLGEFEFSFGGGAASGQFNLQNSDVLENIHILLPDEDFDVSNRLTPGMGRTVSRTDLEVGESVTARAGRNGTVLATATCPVVTESDYVAEVNWDGAALTCTATGEGDDGDAGITPGTVLQVPIDNEGGAAVPAPVTDTISGVDYGVVGVLDAHTPDVVPPPVDPDQISINLDELGLENVQRLHLGTATAWVPDVPDGVTVATLTAEYAEGGSPTTLDLVIGQNTSEWSYDRAEHVTVLGGVQHARATPLYDFQTTIDSASEYTGYVYSITLPLDSTRTLACLTLAMSDVAGYVDLRPEGTSQTWAGQVMTAVTLEGPAGTPATVGSCDTVPDTGGENDDDGDGVPDDIDECPNTPAGTDVDDVGCPLDGGVTVEETFTGLAEATGGDTESPASATEVPDSILSVIEDATAAGASFDVLFIIDNTGSMVDDINAVRDRLDEILTLIETRGDGTQRVGVMTYADVCVDEVPLAVLQDLTTDLEAVRTAIEGITLAFGGDLPESVYDAIVFAMDPANFSFENANRFALLIGDAPPQSPGGECYRATFQEAINAASAAGVEVNLYPIIVPTDF